MVDNPWFLITLRDFDPATALWRALELEQVYQLISRVNIQKPILDLGCGEGRIYKDIFPEKDFSVGSDNDLRMLKSAKELGIYRYEVCADACHLPFLKESFSTVFSNSVIEHIPDLDSLLKEIVFILKPGGKFIFTVPTDKFGGYLFFTRLFNKIGLKRLAIKYSSKRISLLNHFHLFSLNIWSDKMKSFSLDVIEAKDYISSDMLSIWDFIAAVQFIWCRIIPGASSLPFKKLFLLPFKYFYNRYEINHRDSGAAILIIAKKQ